MDKPTRNGMGLGATLAWILFSAGTGAAEPGVHEEPPLMLFLEVGEKTVPVAIDTPFPLEGLSRTNSAVLRMGPHREFSRQGLLFRYPREFSFEAEKTESGLLIWTLSGSDVTLLVNWFQGEGDHAELRQSVLGQFESTLRVEGKGAKDRRSKRSKAMLPYRTGSLAGESTTFEALGIRMEQSVFSFAGADGSFVLVLQDTGDEGGLPSAERSRIGELLKESLVLPPPPPPPARRSPSSKKQTGRG